MEFNRKTLIYIIIPIVAILLIVVLWFGLSPPLLTSNQVVFWGTEDQKVFEDLLRGMAGTNIKVEYVQKSAATYGKDLLNAMASGKGPDVFFVQNNQLPKYQDKISPLPSSLMPLKNFYDTFVDVATQDFVVDGNIWAVPLSVDTLALYYNKDFFNTVGIAEPPKNWDQFKEDVARLTVKSDDGSLSRAGAAIGSSLNINSATDILFLLMLQTGTNMTDKDKTKAAFNDPIVSNGETSYPGEMALSFYTNFTFPQLKQSAQNASYTWNPKMENSLESFCRGRTAMTLDYSSAISQINAKAPYLNFAIAGAPQTQDAQVAVSYANYSGLTVWSGSKNPQAAWQTILWLAQKENDQKYLEAVNKPTSRRDLIEWQKNNPNLGTFAVQALSARSWYQVDVEAIQEIFSQMIETVVYSKASVKDALERAANQVTDLMQQNKK